MFVGSRVLAVAVVFVQVLVCLLFWLFVCLSVCFVGMSVCLFIFLSVCLSVS